MPDIKTKYSSLVDTSAKPQMAYLPTDFVVTANNLHKTVLHWHDAYNGGLLCEQPMQRLLTIANCNHFHKLMTALNIPLEYAGEFRKNLKHFNGTLNDFMIFYKDNPELFRTEDYFGTPKRAQSECLIPQNDNVKAPFYNKIKKTYLTVTSMLSSWFTLKNANYDETKRAKILAYRAEYFRQHHKFWRNVAISIPFLSLWTWGYRHVTDVPTPINDNIAKTTILSNGRISTVSVPTLDKSAGWSNLPRTDWSFLNNLAHDASQTINTFINGAAKVLKNTSSSALPQDEYTAKLIAQKDKDLAEFSQLYRQCSYSNYLKLSDGYKSETFRAANRSLKKHGIKPLHPRLYCAGMSIASLCQAQDIFRQKHPNSYLLPAIDEILNNCRNIHHCATLKKDLKKITNSYTYSSNPSYDIQNYMQTHKNAIVFFWSPRGGGNFHHQTFFPTKTSDNLYTYTSFNRQRWGNQEDFQNFLGSKRNKWGYFTDFTEGLDNIATKYIEKDAQKHRNDLAQAAVQSIYNLKQAALS